MKKKILKSKQKILFSFLCGMILIIFTWLVESSMTSPLPQENEASQLYANQTNDNLRQLLKNAIENSKESISLIIYTLTDDEIIQALRRKSNEGVFVRVICDAKACPYLEKKLGSQVHILKRFAAGIMHQKILVIDHKEVWMGSANMTPESLSMHGNLINAMISPELAEMIEKKADHLLEYGRDQSFSHKDFQIGKQTVEMWFLPDNSKGSLRIKELIRSAKKTIRVAMFTWTREDFADEIVKAQKQGVQVEIILDKNSANGTSAKIVELLKQSGISVRLSDGPGLLHHKFLYIDENILENGSANWTKAAFSLNDDSFIVLHDLTEEQRNQMKALWKAILANSTPE